MWAVSGQLSGVRGHYVGLSWGVGFGQVEVEQLPGAGRWRLRHEGLEAIAGATDWKYYNAYGRFSQVGPRLAGGRLYSEGDEVSWGFGN
jgi:hypothetical protein